MLSSPTCTTRLSLDAFYKDEIRSRTSDQISDEKFEKNYERTSITTSQVNDRTMHMLYSYSQYICVYGFIYMYTGICKYVYEYMCTYNIIHVALFNHANDTDASLHHL